MYTPDEIRQIEVESAPVSITQAVEESVEQIEHAMPSEELDALILTMDVKTMAELTPAFGHAYTRAKESGDEAAKKKLKAIYDDMKGAIESGGI
jgi:hypothetical protein